VGIFSYGDSRILSLGALPAAQLALGIVTFFLCLAFIGLYILIRIKVSNGMSNKQQQIAYSLQQP
jgi:hypothetical protein